MSGLRKGGCAGLILICCAVILYIAIPVFVPGPGIPIPADCTPRSSTVEKVLLGKGTELNIIWKAGSGGQTGTVQLLHKGQVVVYFPLHTQVVVAALSRGYVYLYDNKLGYILNVETGRKIPSWVELDNYRGMYTANGRAYVQQQALITLIGPSFGVARNSLSMRGVVGSCHIH